MCTLRKSCRVRLCTYWRKKNNIFDKGGFNIWSETSFCINDWLVDSLFISTIHLCHVILWLSANLWEKFLRMYVVPRLKSFRLWHGEFGFGARGRPKGLPYIIHYALAHQAARAVLLWSQSKRALVISLPLGGQLLEQKRQKLQSTPACSDCSERASEREREWWDGGLLFGMVEHGF